MCEQWPNFFIVGAPKCGTTSLYVHLRDHPQVFMPDDKEPQYFSRPDEWHPQGEAAYKSLFAANADKTAVGEASPSYLFDESAPARIHEKVPDARIIILLRDPIQRAYSHYLMTVAQGLQDLGFYDALIADAKTIEDTPQQAHFYIETGLYAAQVRRYLDLFGADRVCVLMMDDLERNPHGLLQRTAAFLGIDPSWAVHVPARRAYNRWTGADLPRNSVCQKVVESEVVYRAAKAIVFAPARRWIYTKILFRTPRKPRMEAKAKRYLEQIYRPQIPRLEEMLGRSLPWRHKYNLPASVSFPGPAAACPSAGAPD